jgi:hypothetical protein
MCKRNLINLTIVVMLLLGFGLACTGFPFPQPQTANPSATPAPAAAQTPTPDEENAKLREKVAELEKRIEEWQEPQPIIVQQPPTTVVRPTAPPVVKGSTHNAWVNSPGDGFLGVRNAPNVSGGYRIIQIPHGANVTVLGCQGYSERVSGRTGRWCRVSYGGHTGWAFDGWLVYQQK